jgi:hypothetical protein
MKNTRLLTVIAVSLLGAAFASAQTTDEIIGKYLNAIGGKDQVGQISSLYMEGTMDAMGNQGTIKITQVNGRGYKEEIDVMGTQVVFCYTDSTGWQIYPMTGNYGAETMSESQYQASRDQIFIGGPFVSDYLTKGYQVELLEPETVGNINAYRVKVVSPANAESIYYFDPETFYLIRMVQKAEMMGQVMDVVASYSDYQKAENGYAMPYSIETNYGGQVFLTVKIAKVEFNQPVDLAVFAKPQ